MVDYICAVCKCKIRTEQYANNSEIRQAKSGYSKKYYATYKKERAEHDKKI